MFYSNRQKYIEKVERPKICGRCVKNQRRKNEVEERRAILELFKNRGY